MNPFLLLIAIIIFFCVFAHCLSDRLGLPVLLAFIVLGMLFGSDGILEIPFDNLEVSEKICSVALIIIMFYGGFGTNWESAKPVAIPAMILSSVGVLLTTLLMGFFGSTVLHLSLNESLLLGAILSSTDAASVFSILRSKKLNLKHHTAPMLEIESGSNDPFAYMLTFIFLTMMEKEVHFASLIGQVISQLLFALLCGCGVAWITGKLMHRIHFGSSGYDMTFILAAAIFSYAFSSTIGGNGYLSTYITGIILGNQWLPNKKALVHFFDGLTSLMQMLIFFLLGLLSFPSQIIPVLPLALAVSLFLIFVARPISIFLLLQPFHASLNQKMLVSFAGLRGASSIVFAIMATLHEASFHQDMFHIVFFVVLFSISLQGSLLPYAAKKLDMIDDQNENVLKTFNDYSKEASLRFIRLQITPDHVWCQRKIEDLGLPPSLLIAMLIRGQQKIVPHGKTIIESGDDIMLVGQGFDQTDTKPLQEYYLENGDERIGQTLEALAGKIPPLVILIKRDESFFIPDGQTVLKKDDILVFY